MNYFEQYLAEPNWGAMGSQFPIDDPGLFMQMGMGGPMFGGGGFTVHSVNINNGGVQQQTRTTQRIPTTRGIPPELFRMLFRM